MGDYFPLWKEGGGVGGRKNWSGKVWPRAKEAFVQQETGLFPTEAFQIVFLARWTYNMFQRNTVARSKDWADYSSISNSANMPSSPYPQIKENTCLNK